MSCKWPLASGPEAGEVKKTEEGTYPGSHARVGGRVGMAVMEISFAISTEAIGYRV